MPNSPSSKERPTVDIDALVAAALEARQRAYAPYSKFSVGAALLTADGRVFLGCNVENASYGLCYCAERTAIVSAVAAGATGIAGPSAAPGAPPPPIAMAVAADTHVAVSPCGACRQFMVEFNPAMQVILANLNGERHITTAAELLPIYFGPSDLESKPGFRGPQSGGKPV